MIERLTHFMSGPSFHRGLALGALVGAAIAGSTLWTRLREAQRASGDGGGRAAPPRLVAPGSESKA